MASSSPSERDHNNQNDQSRKEPAGQSSDSNNNNNNHQQPSSLPSTNHHPPPQQPGYAPAMGYPPPPPHVGYQHGHGQPGYPPQYGYYQNGYNHHHHHQQQYPYAQPPPAAYYNPQYSYQSPGTGFIRGIIAAMIFLVVVTCLTTIITWIVLRPEIPGFHVDRFSVSNFNLSSNPRLISNWEANLTVFNPNTKLKIDITRIYSYVFYKGGELASSIMDSMFLDTKTNATINTGLTSNIADQSILGDLGKDRDKGIVVVSLRMTAYTTFKSGSWWTKHAFMRVFCEDLQVAFPPAATSGGLVPGKGGDCTVYV